ncbi:hypothetical protein [Streptomyces sp. NPDC001741]|uniref:hypothetical protein n=1 Tax=Streptomyces sp. NPDC001741 TaxID=3364605 RepID=UPI003697EE20
MLAGRHTGLDISLGAAYLLETAVDPGNRDLEPAVGDRLELLTDTWGGRPAASPA